MSIDRRIWEWMPKRTTRARHNEAESKVAPELRHEFETDAEHETRLRREQRGSAA